MDNGVRSLRLKIRASALALAAPSKGRGNAETVKATNRQTPPQLITKSGHVREFGAVRNWVSLMSWPFMQDSKLSMLAVNGSLI